MKIAYIVPNLQQAGPIILVQSLVKHLSKQVEEICVFYIDECESPISMDCHTEKIYYNIPLDFDNYDIIHCHTAKADLYGYIWKHKMKKNLLMTTIHQDTFYTERLRLGKIYGTLYSSIWLAIQNQLDALVTISKQTQYTYQPYFKRDIHVIYNGVNCEEGKVDDSLLNKISSFKEKSSILLGTYALMMYSKKIKNEKNKSLLCDIFFK